MAKPQSRERDARIPLVTDLPKGWANAGLQRVTVRIPNFKPEDEPYRKFRYVDISSISNRTQQLTDLKTFKGAEAPSRARRPVTAGDVLFSNVRTYLRNIALVTHDVRADVCSTGFTVLRPNGAIQSRFLLYSVLADSFIDKVTELQTGTHYPAVSDRAVLAQEIPLPPLKEQKRIVAKIEALIVRVDAVRERLAKVPAILKRFRQSVLAAACSGRLTSGNETSWTTKYIKDLLLDSPQNGLYKPQTSYGSGTPIVRIDDFHDGRLRPSKSLKRLLLSEDEVQKYRLNEDELLINRVNSLKFLGKSVVVPALSETTVFESNMMRCRMDESLLNAKYLGIYLRSPRGTDELRSNAKHAVNQASINQTDVAKVPVPLPGLEEQLQIVQRVEALFKVADAIETRVEHATARAERLTQSILAKAFRGELVPTEAELARRDGRQYEPATTLLARVATEQQESNGAHNHRTRRRKDTQKRALPER